MFSGVLSTALDLIICDMSVDVAGDMYEFLVQGWE